MNNISKQFGQYMARRNSKNSSHMMSSQEGPPPRRVSNISDFTDNPTRRGTLDDAMDIDEISVSSSWLPKEVSFSTFSNLHVYEVDRSEKHKSYNSAERKAFHRETCREAARIRSLIEGCPYEGAMAMRYLLDSGVLATEELVGIEHLISRKTGMKNIKERQVHVATVLKKQQELEEKEDINVGKKLAAVAIARSLKSVEKARSRAALAA